MSARRAYLDAGPGESRGVIALDGRPERLLIDRDGDPPVQKLGAQVRARVRAVDGAAGLAFLDLGGGPDAILNLGAGVPKLAEGSMLVAEIRAEARRGKGATARWLEAGEGRAGLVRAAPTLAERLAAFAPAAEVETGAAARDMADQAQAEALETQFPLAGGGAIVVEPTRALIAVDVDLGARREASPGRAARAVNLAAIAAAARVLRLKGLGGLVVIDLAGFGHDARALVAAARAAFAPDNPGVALGSVSRFGALELTVPRRLRPAIERLLEDDGSPSAEAAAFALVRALDREAAADGGGRFKGVAGRTVVDAATAALQALRARVGGRVTLEADDGLAAGRWEVKPW